MYGNYSLRQLIPFKTKATKILEQYAQNMPLDRQDYIFSETDFGRFLIHLESRSI